MRHYRLHQQTYQLPTYLPDATLAVVRNLMPDQVVKAGIEGLVVNTYHLRSQPGADLLTKLGGVHTLMNWPGFITSDSGGFQLFSLITKNPNLGKVVDDGVVIYRDSKKQHKELFTPEISIALQFAIGSDIMICLDDFTPPDADQARLETSVLRTIEWAARSKAEFERQLALRNLNWQSVDRPRLFAPIQGHDNKIWREKCAKALLEIGFDGYGLGGWPFAADGSFDYEFCRFSASLTPDEFPRFALGIGTPANIIALRQMGYDFFDCVLPTRDARHHRLYVLDETKLTALYPTIITNPTTIPQNQWLTYEYLNRGFFADQTAPLDKDCPCQLCQQYSPAYLHHLFKVGDALAFQLATLHNLTTYSRVIGFLRQQESA